MRRTIHIVSRREFWRYGMGLPTSLRTWAARVRPAGIDETTVQAAGTRPREALADGPRTVTELGELGKGFVGNLAPLVEVVRVPTSGTRERRRADRLALAEDWVGPVDATEDEGLEHLVRAYLRAFGPAPWRDIASWAGASVADVRRGGTRLALERYRAEEGSRLIDLPGAPLPEPATAAPVRFLPRWDANLRVHARRTGLLPEPYRARVFSVCNPFSVGTYLADGELAGAWSVKDGRVVLEPYRDLPAADRRAVERERESLEAFHV